MDNWRRIDIDALEYGKHMTKDELVPNLSPVSYEQAAAISKQAKAALSQGRFVEALVSVLDNPPYVADEPTKEVHSQTVFEILCSIRNNLGMNDLPGIVKQLNSEQQDTLIKYLYKNMGSSYGAKQGGLLLGWFEKTVEVTGIGSIVRYIPDRRTV